MTDPLKFRCTECGECCRRLRVAVTAWDVQRLARAGNAAPPELVQWLKPDEVDMTGEPDSFVELSGGRRLMVLAQRDGACVYLNRDNRCAVYAVRPLDCRTYPFDFSEARGGKRRLTLLALGACDFASDGDQDLAALERTDQARANELVRYRALVASWNRGAWHRRRLGQRAGSEADFLEFALTHADASSSASPRPEPA